MYFRNVNVSRYCSYQVKQNAINKSKVQLIQSRTKKLNQIYGFPNPNAELENTVSDQFIEILRSFQSFVQNFIEKQGDTGLLQ